MTLWLKLKCDLCLEDSVYFCFLPAVYLTCNSHCTGMSTHPRSETGGGGGGGGGTEDVLEGMSSSGRVGKKN